MHRPESVNEQPEEPKKSRSEEWKRTGHSSLKPIISTLILLSFSAPCEAAARHSDLGENVSTTITLVIVLILCNGFFAMSEAALLTVRRTRIRQLVEEGNHSAKMVEHLLSDPTRLMATLQIGVTLIGLFSAAEAAAALGPWLSQVFLSAGLLTSTEAKVSAVIFITLVVALLTLVIGEIAPKSIAIHNSERISLMVVWPIRTIEWITIPVVSVVTLLANMIVRPFGGTASFHPPAISTEELKLMVEASEEQGVIKEEEKEMIHSIFDFADTMVRKVMTPRIDITAIESNATIDELVMAINASGHSRIPVYQEDLDNILGVVYAKDLLREMEVKGKASMFSRVMREPYFIPENKRVNDLLREFRRKRLQMAIVRDEYGTISGLVTVEDLLEEIVGDIGDEYDVEEPLIQTIDENTWIIDGRLSLDDFNDRMGAHLPSDEADTVGGYVFGLLGHMPEAGEWVQQDGMIFRVAATDGRRITQVRVERCEDEQSVWSETDQSVELSNEENQEGMRNSDSG